VPAAWRREWAFPALASRPGDGSNLFVDVGVLVWKHQLQMIGICHAEIAEASVARLLGSLGRGEIASIERLSGGTLSEVWSVRYENQSTLVAKTLRGAPANFFRLEAEGLAALRETRTVQVPEVLAATERLLLLEPLRPRDDSPARWESFAHELVALHRSTVSDRFGWPHDNYCGKLRQTNRWTTDGHAFFAEHRLLRYLDEPLIDKALNGKDRRALQRLCDRLPELVPPMPAVLTHGDLWANNLLSGRDRGLALVDPAVSYTWAENDLAMLSGCAPPATAARFFDVYRQLNPSAAGWHERMPILFLRELLSVVAQRPLPASAAALDQLRTTLAPHALT
jgi:fructosamine-3-kinase